MTIAEIIKKAARGEELNALEKASKFGTIPNGNLGLLDDGDRLLIELKHK